MAPRLHLRLAALCAVLVAGVKRTGPKRGTGRAVAAPASMPYVLLGNSFLTQFQMTRINDQMVLERRY